jgi:hypothetical protein
LDIISNYPNSQRKRQPSQIELTAALKRLSRTEEMNQDKNAFDTPQFVGRKTTFYTKDIQYKFPSAPTSPPPNILDIKKKLESLPSNTRKSFAIQDISRGLGASPPKTAPPQLPPIPNIDSRKLSISAQKPVLTLQQMSRRLSALSSQTSAGQRQSFYLGDVSKNLGASPPTSAPARRTSQMSPIQSARPSFDLGDIRQGFVSTPPKAAPSNELQLDIRRKSTQKSFNLEDVSKRIVASPPRSAPPRIQAGSPTSPTSYGVSRQSFQLNDITRGLGISPPRTAPPNLPADRRPSFVRRLSTQGQIQITSPTTLKPRGSFDLSGISKNIHGLPPVRPPPSMNPGPSSRSVSGKESKHKEDTILEMDES